MIHLLQLRTEVKRTERDHANANPDGGLYRLASP
jgi:hypothetical protein